MSFLRWKPQDSVAVEHQPRLTTFVEHVAAPGCSNNDLFPRMPGASTVRHHGLGFLNALASHSTGLLDLAPSDLRRYHETCRGTNRSAEQRSDVGRGSFTAAQSHTSSRVYHRPRLNCPGV